MTEAIYYYLLQLGASVPLSSDLRELEIECAPEILTHELVDLIREHKDGLVDLAFSLIEREAIEAEGCESEVEKPLPVVTFEGDGLLIELVRNHPAVRSLVEYLSQHSGGVIEVGRDERRRAA
ncbi:MAG: hypothetical protein M3R15_32285 [Acidobacteriota bacterium]|nr:hypothetical protein [Acidobacteriota bacterium]